MRSNLLQTVAAALAVAGPLVLAVRPAAAQTVVPLRPFRSVVLRNGGEVILRHAAHQRVTLPAAAAGRITVRIVEEDRLEIDRHGRCDEPVEILTPALEEIGVRDGGVIATRGRFPGQAELRLSVADGGIVDLRSIAAERVTAEVQDGGRILTRAQATLLARIARGGAVTYWGNPRVTSRVRHGGAITRGEPADEERMLRDLGP